MKKTSKIIWTVLYLVGTCSTLILSMLVLSRSDIVLNKESMIQFQLHEQAFGLLAFGAIPMIIACYMVNKGYEIKKSYHPKRNSVIIFIPGIVCTSCAIYLLVLIIFGMINSFVLR